MKVQEIANNKFSNLFKLIRYIIAVSKNQRELSIKA